jgi:hypothetical protein
MYEGKMMAQTNAEFLQRSYVKDFLIMALGAVLFENIEWNSLLQWRIHIRRQDVLASISS